MGRRCYRSTGNPLGEPVLDLSCRVTRCAALGVHNDPMSRIRIGFVLLSGSHQALPSTRISVLNMFPYLRDAGFEPTIVFEPAQESLCPDLDALDADAIARRCDIVYFQKVCGDSVLRLVNRLERAGVRTVYGVCDVVEPEMVRATSATAIVTEYLRGLHPAELLPKIHVVHDGIEAPEQRKADYGGPRGTPGNPLRAVLVSSGVLETLPVIGRPPPWLHVTLVGDYPKPRGTGQRLRWLRWKTAGRPPGERVRFVARMLDPRLARVPWHPLGVYAQMVDADVGIIPVDTDGPAYWRLKSENRLTLKMSVGLPVVATPVPAYEPVLEHGRNGYFARTRAEWLECLEALRDPALRRTIGQRARAAVLPRYSKETQAQALIATLQAALEHSTAGATG